MKHVKPIVLLIATLHATPFVFAQEQDSEKSLQDMSDPLAVYTQAGVGITDKGFNIKVGQSYTPSTPGFMAMNVLEIKGIGGDLLGIRDNDDALYNNVDDSIDYFRFRNFKADMKKGRGQQLDVNYNVDKNSLDASYSFLQALPKLGIIQLYPLAGVGLTVADNYSGDNNGYEFPGTFFVAGMYSKIDITDKIWINYNPMYMHTLSGSSDYKDSYYAGDDNILVHEVAISYQISERANIRYFANWNKHVDFADADHRIEFNYQF